LGLGWVTQRVPFHRSTKVPELAYPTAVHALADGHDTPDTSLKPERVGVLWIVQRLPFQRSTNDAALLV
jgi:hypothetical protein